MDVRLKSKASSCVGPGLSTGAAPYAAENGKREGKTNSKNKSGQVILITFVAVSPP